MSLEAKGWWDWTPKAPFNFQTISEEIILGYIWNEYILSERHELFRHTQNSGTREGCSMSVSLQVPGRNSMSCCLFINSPALDVKPKSNHTSFPNQENTSLWDKEPKERPGKPHLCCESGQDGKTSGQCIPHWLCWKETDDTYQRYLARTLTQGKTEKPRIQTLWN